jgi:hypothetical protein
VLAVKATGRALERTLYSTSLVISVSPKVVSSFRRAVRQVDVTASIFADWPPFDRL